ncbi:MAG TPA: AAA family ATPase, partial [Acidimicrobiia bacterium]|nr:AAA family ATPase [Acidimicrobiia bacterium]
MIRRLTLQNWRAYENLELDFRPGATFVVAPNGVGKSSIVEGARFALFGNVAPAREGAARVARTGTTSASVEVELPSGRLLSVTRPYPAKPRGSTTPTVILDGEAQPPDTLEALLAEEYGAEPAFLARLAMLHSSTVFAEAKGLDLRDHLCRVFGVDGLVAALDQTKTLAAVAKRTVDSARKPVAAVADAELAALAEVEARAADLIEAADAERAEAEQALARAREATEATARYGAWKAAALLGRAESSDVATLPADLEAAEQRAVEALDDVRRRRARLAGRAEAIRAGLAELEGAEGSCPVCRRPLEPDDVDAARSGHE